VDDITVGEHPWLRGHWSDRLPAIDEDIARMAGRLESAKAVDDAAVRAAVEAAAAHPVRDLSFFRHKAPARFRPKDAMALEIAVEGTTPEGVKLSGARLYYRHVNHAERWQSAEMQPDGSAFHGTIPASYTASPYPMQYYFELKSGPKQAWLY